MGGVSHRICADCGRPVQWIGKGTRILYDQAQKNTEIGVLDVGTAKRTTIVRAEGKMIYTPRLSPDGKTLAFTQLAGPNDRRTCLVPFSDNRIIPETEWKTLTPGPPLDERRFLSGRRTAAFSLFFPSAMASGAYGACDSTRTR